MLDVKANRRFGPDCNGVNRVLTAVLACWDVNRHTRAVLSRLLARCPTVALPRFRILTLQRCRSPCHWLPSSWGQHASTIMQSVMTAEERGYPMEKELPDYVAERAELDQ